MGFLIWYQLGVLVAEGLPPLLRVSNDILAGEYVVDAKIETAAAVGPQAATFSVTLHDLPVEAVTLVTSRYTAADDDSPLLVEIRLGYFDRPATREVTVLLGAVTDLETTVDGEGRLLTTVAGTELAGHRLLTRPFTFDRPGRARVADILAAVSAAAGVPVIAGTDVHGDREDHTVAAETAMAALRRIAADAAVPLAVRDGRALLGAQVGAGPAARFGVETDIVRQGGHKQGGASADAPTDGLELIVLGNPELHVGQRATVDGGDPLTLTGVRHKFIPTAGFTTEVNAVVGALDLPHKARNGTVESLLDGLDQRTRSALADRPAVQVGDVTGYQPGGSGDQGGHRATVRFGQDPAADVPTPSVDTATATQLLHDKPIAAPFAFDRCGLVVPVYEGMRSVLVHNRGETSDAVSAGFVWRRDEGHTPPANVPGDWWLCLPTELTDGRPSGKGVNDLVDATGRRVLQARGLAVDIGEERLPPVGTRPTELPADGTLVITHGSGTTITVDAGGAVSIVTGGSDLALGNGQASITISGATITLAASSVEVGP